MIDLSDPRTRERLAVEADVSTSTLKRFLRFGERACRPSSVRRIREAQGRMETAATGRQGASV